MSESFVTFLEALADENRQVRTLDLPELSDLTRDELANFCAAWQSVSPDRRLELISTMVAQAEVNIHLNFHAILRVCLRDADARIRKLAVEGLWEDEKTNLVSPLIELLNGDTAADVRAAAAMSLGRYMLLGALGEIADAPARRVETALHAAWCRFAEPAEVRRRALESLAYSSSPAIHEMIHSAYYDEDELMRQSAVFAMGRSADTRWSRFVITELNNPQPAMRFESAAAAGELALREAVQPLIQRLDDPDGGVRKAAAAALGKIGGPAARRALLVLLRGPDEALAHAAEDALDELTFNSQNLDDVLMDYGDEADLEDLEGEVIFDADHLEDGDALDWGDDGWENEGWEDDDEDRDGEDDDGEDWEENWR